MQLTKLFKSTFSLFIFLFIFNQIAAQTPWVKKKVLEKAPKYWALDMEIQKYDWSDAELNDLLGKIEKHRIQKKAFIISGSIGLGYGLLTMASYAGTAMRDCDPNDSNYPQCKSYNQNVKRARILYLTNITVGGTILISGIFQNKKQQKATVRALERYKELGL